MRALGLAEIGWLSQDAVPGRNPFRSKMVKISRLVNGQREVCLLNGGLDSEQTSFLAGF